AKPWGTSTWPSAWINVRSGDFNGDGLTDIAGWDPATGNWQVSLSTGTGFAPPQVWGNWDKTVAWTDILVGDFNGDGQADVAGRNSNGHLEVALPQAGDYQVQATWHTYYNQLTNAPYAIYDGTNLVQTVLVDQTQVPNGASYGGVPFQTLATVNIKSGTLKV